MEGRIYMTTKKLSRLEEPLAKFAFEANFASGSEEIQNFNKVVNIYQRASLKNYFMQLSR